MCWRQMSAWMLYVVQTSFSGQATSPTPLSTQQHPHHPHASPSRHPHAPHPSWACFTWHEWNSNTLQAACKQPSTNKRLFNTQIKSVSVYLPPLPSICCKTPHQMLISAAPLCNWYFCCKCLLKRAERVRKREELDFVVSDENIMWKLSYFFFTVVTLWILRILFGQLSSRKAKICAGMRRWIVQAVI